MDHIDSTVARNWIEASMARARPEVIVIARESDRDDLQLLHGMVLQTCLVHIGAYPELALVRDAGLGPVKSPGQYGAEERRGVGYRAVLWQVGRVLFVYYRGSAAKESKDGDNEFTNLLIDLVEALEPKEIRVAVFTRLARSNTTGAQLLRVLKKHRAVVHCGDLVIDVSTHNGEMLWMMLMMVAAAERVSIVTRTVLGKIAAAARNESPFGPHVVPLGYKREGKRLVPDPDRQQAVLEMLMMLADAVMPSAEFTKRCGGLGFTRPRIKQHHGEEATVADAVEAKDVRASIIAFLPLYETGRWVMQMQNPLSEVDQFADIVVERSGPNDPGVVPIAYEWGLPPDGWAPPEVFEMIRTAEAQRRTGRGSNHRATRRPFTGRTWVANSRQWRLESSDAVHYIVASYPLDAAGEPARRPNGSLSADGRCVEARMDTGAFHTAVFSGILDALERAGGLPATINQHVIAGRAINRVEAQRAALIARADRLDSQAARARSRSHDLDDDALALELLRDASQLAKDAVAVRDSARLLIEQDTDEPIDVDSTTAAAALAALSKTKATASRTICDALDRILVDFELHLNGDQLSWSVYLAAPTTGADIALLGPITGSATTKAWRRSVAGPLRPAVRRDVCLQALRSGMTLAEMQALPESTTFRHLLKELTTMLEDAGLDAIRAPWAVTIPVTEARRTLIAVTLDGHLPNLPADHDGLADYLQREDLVPEGCDPRWAATLIQRLVQSDPRRTRWATNSSRRRHILGCLVAAGGTATLRELSVASGVGRWVIINELLQASRNGWEPVLEWADEPAYINGIRRPSADNRVRLRSCPHCDGYSTFALNAPEITGHLICTSCLRTREPDSPIYPASYLEAPACGVGTFAQESLAQATRLRAGSEHTPRRKCNSEASSSPADLNAITQAYREGQHIAGPGGILDTWDIATSSLYRIIDTAGTPRRQPTKISRSQTTADPTDRS